MIISEQEKNRIRGLHKQYSIINEQTVVSKESEGTLKTLLHEWIDWLKSSTGAQEARAAMNGCTGNHPSGFKFPPSLTTKFPKWKKLKDAALAVLPSKKGILPNTFADYLCTALNSKYNGDWDIIDPKFPEFNF